MNTDKKPKEAIDVHPWLKSFFKQLLIIDRPGGRSHKS